MEIRFDPALLLRHDGAGPRYTSYPTAAQFRADFPSRKYLEAAQRPSDAPLSLYVHLPFCRSACYYCGCHRLIARNPARGRAYLETLLAEVALEARLHGSGRRVDQLHFGGGSPSFHPAGELAALIAGIGRHFEIHAGDDRDHAVEIDPRTLVPDDIATLAAAGINRISLGVQDFDLAVQDAVNRHQTHEQVATLVAAARRAGIASINFDLICGLPRQTESGFARTLAAVVALRPDRIACYAYAHLPERFPAQAAIDPAELPDAATRLALLGLTIETLTGAGYVAIGMDHYALPDDPLARAQREGSLHRSFQGYGTHGHLDLIGVGISAIGRVGPVIVQKHKEITSWRQQIAAGRLPVARGLETDDDDRMRQDLIEHILCFGQVDLASFARRHADVLGGMDFRQFFARDLERLAPLVDDGLVVLSGDRLQVTAAGTPLLRAVAMAFDAWWHGAKRAQAAPARHARLL